MHPLKTSWEETLKKENQVEKKSSLLYVIKNHAACSIFKNRFHFSLFLLTSLSYYTVKGRKITRRGSRLLRVYGNRRETKFFKKKQCKRNKRLSTRHHHPSRFHFSYSFLSFMEMNFFSDGKKIENGKQGRHWKKNTWVPVCVCVKLSLNEKSEDLWETLRTDGVEYVITRIFSTWLSYKFFFFYSICQKMVDDHIFVGIFCCCLSRWRVSHRWEVNVKRSSSSLLMFMCDIQQRFFVIYFQDTK